MIIRSRKPVGGSLVWSLRVCGVIALVILLLLNLPKSHDVQLSHIDLRWLGWCMLLTLLQLCLEAFVWHWLLSTQGIRYVYPKTLRAYLASQYLGLVTPGHVGEFLAAGYISMETGITFGYALSSVVMKKILNWIVVVGFGLWGLQLLGQLPLLQHVRGHLFVSLAVPVILAAGIALWVVSLRKLAKKWQRLSPWQIETAELYAGLKQLLTTKLVWPLLATVVSFSLLFVQLDAVLRALGVARPFLLMAKIVSCSRIVARIVPLSVVGFGSKDLAVLGLLTQQGLTPSAGLTVTLLLLICSYLVTLLLSAICWWVKPLIVRRAQATNS